MKSATSRAAAFCIAAVVAITPVLTGAAGDKNLQNEHGNVSVQSAGGATRQVAPKARQAVNDGDTAITGNNTLADLIYPDSSEILIGMDSKLAVGSFSQSDVNRAQFQLVQGKIRFRVRHPNGAQANYTFKTQTGQIAVRGTEGDASLDPQGNLQVNVYETNPANPVQVTLQNGRVFNLYTGQTLSVNVSAAAAATAGTQVVSNVTRQAFSPFHEFGLPANAHALGIVAASTVAAPTAIAAAAVVPTAVIVANNNTPATSSPTATPTPTAAPTPTPTASPSPTPSPSPSPSPTPSPTPTPVSVPITIQGGNSGSAAMPGVPTGPGGLPSMPGPYPGPHVPQNSPAPGGPHTPPGTVPQPPGGANRPTPPREG